MKQIYLIIIILTLLSINGLAQSQTFESVEAFLKSTLKDGDKLEFEAKGDLNGDGLADWAGLIQRKKVPPFKDEEEGETDETVQIYILLQQKQGSYQIAEKSKETGIFGAGNNYFEALEIKKSSLFLQLNSTAYASFSQFRLHNGKWRLVGWREFKLNVESDKSLETDRNLLTGTVIEKRQTGNRKPIIKRYKKKFPRVLLKDFNLFGWNDIE
jgi:hypothetical protein